jgi:hypothetical protein
MHAFMNVPGGSFRCTSNISSSNQPDFPPEA